MSSGRDGLRHVAVLLAFVLIAVGCGPTSPQGAEGTFVSSADDLDGMADGADSRGPEASSGTDSGQVAGVEPTDGDDGSEPAVGAPPAAESGTSGGGAPGPVAEAVTGVTDDTIRIAYYWSAGQTENNPFLQAFPQANANEARAIRAFVDYVNEFAADGGQFYGYPIDLHGRKLELHVVDAGMYNEPEKNRAAAERIAREIEPFAALSNGGVISTRICPILASAGILNFGTLSYRTGLNASTGGFCFSGMVPWEVQVEASVRYLATRAARTSYQPPSGLEEARVFGLAYAEWPELIDAVPKLVQRLRAAGVDVAAVAAGGDDLGPQQQQAPNIVAQFRAAGVNTVIFPEGVLPLAFTNAAESQAYFPDYYIWPCSGQDIAALVRFYNSRQWERATGLTCLDPDVVVDVSDRRMEDTEWFRQYRQADPQTQPPAAAPLIYHYLLPLLAGITEAGPELTPETFRQGLQAVEPYRYSYRSGRSTDAVHHLVGPFRSGEYSTINDFTILQWDGDTRADGGLPGTYVFPEGGRRYRPTDFS